MALRPWWLAVAAAAGLLACATGAQADIQLQLRFDNEVLDPKATPDFTCYSYTLNRWVGCRVRKSGAPGAYVLETLGPGKYQMHVSVDENPANPRRFPGDYETQLSFEVTATGPERLVVDLARLIHLTRPGDNARAIEGMLTSCTKQPQFDTPRYSWGPTATVDFAWEPIAAGAEYRYTLVARTCGQAGAGRDILSGQTTKTTAALSVRPTTDGEYYVFRVEAWKDDRLVGDLYTHDGGAHSWNYRFRVRNASLPRWAYLAAGAGLVVLLLGARRLFGVIDSEGRRVRRFGRGVIAVLVIAAVAGAGYHYLRERQQRIVEAERARLEAERQARQREFIAAFVSAAPRPDWWDSVETPYTRAVTTAAASVISSRRPIRASSTTRMIRRWWRRPSASCTGWSATTPTVSSSRDSATSATSTTAGAPTTAPTAWWAIPRRVSSRT